MWDVIVVNSDNSHLFESHPLIGDEINLMAGTKQKLQQLVGELLRLAHRPEAESVVSPECAAFLGKVEEALSVASRLT